MISNNNSNVTNTSSDAGLTESNSSSIISKFNIPSYTRILVPHDGKETSDKALNHAIYLSNLSGAEIVILCIVKMLKSSKGLKLIYLEIKPQTIKMILDMTLKEN
jgi:nucleotide-binding universal stress UspA family protein